MKITLLPIYIIVVLVLAACSNQPTGKYKPTKQDAVVQAQLCAEKYVKNPGSVVHPYLPDESVDQLNDTTFEVLNYLDAENDFGALKRMYYKCKVVIHSENSGECIDMKVEYR